MKRRGATHHGWSPVPSSHRHVASSGERFEEHCSRRSTPAAADHAGQQQHHAPTWRAAHARTRHPPNPAADLALHPSEPRAAVHPSSPGQGWEQPPPVAGSKLARGKPKGTTRFDDVGDHTLNQPPHPTRPSNPWLPSTVLAPHSDSCQQAARQSRMRLSKWVAEDYGQLNPSAPRRHHGSRTEPGGR